MGLKGLELILEKWFNKNIKDVEKVVVKKPKSRRKKIKKD
jgi:DNA replication protein DnaD